MAAAAVPDSSHPSHQSTSHQQPPSEKASQMAQFLKSGGQTRRSELPPSYNQVLLKENPVLWTRWIIFACNQAMAKIMILFLQPRSG